MSTSQNSTEQLERYRAQREKLEANNRAWNSQLDEKLARNAQLQSKVQQLQIAKTHMMDARGTVNEIGSMMQRVTPGEWWGANWDKFSAAMLEDAVFSAHKNTLSQANKTIEEIEHEIQVLSSQIDILAEAIGALRSWIRDGEDKITTIASYMSALPR